MQLTVAEISCVTACQFWEPEKQSIDSGVQQKLPHPCLPMNAIWSGRSQERRT